MRLTIDRDLQYVAQKALSEKVAAAHADRYARFQETFTSLEDGVRDYVRRHLAGNQQRLTAKSC